MRYEKTIQIRVPMEIYRDNLLATENYSEYIRDLIEQDIQKKRDPKLLKRKIEEHKQQIRELQDLLKDKSVNQEEINKLLSFFAPTYQNLAPTRIEKHRLDWINRNIWPKLKKLGFKGSLREIDKILINWGKEEK